VENIDPHLTSFDKAVMTSIVMRYTLYQLFWEGVEQHNATKREQAISINKYKTK
jgi:hypothetical protein